MISVDEFLGASIPRDVEAEQAVLGSILLESGLIGAVREIVTPEMFYDRAHEKIFRRMCDLDDDGEAIDVITLTDRLRQHEELEDVGGVTYLARLVGGIPTTAHAEHYARMVREKYLLRRSIEEGMALMKNAAQSGDPAKVISAMQEAAAKLSELAAPPKEIVPVAEVLMGVYETVEKRFENRDTFRGVTGIASGYPDLDRMTAGFQRSDLIILAGRPSMGKTAFALNIAQNVGKRGEPVAIFSLEMSASQLGERLLTSESGVEAGRLRTGYLETDDWEKVTMAIGALSEATIYIDDTPGLMVHEIRSKCRRLKERRGLSLVIIDYLQLIAAPRRPGVNRTQEVSEITRALKQMARELDVPVIALSQLSRGVEQRQDKRPMLSDLRESGEIEQTADTVMFLYREDYYQPESEKKNITEVIIAKQRNGPVGTVELVFLKQFNKFVSLDRGHDEPAARREPDPRRRWA